ncbi:MAG: hypothetical protein AAF828_10760, partial [Bacteroidota bacterium]
GGLSNEVRQPLELTAALHFGKSPTCGAFGEANVLSGNSGRKGNIVCPQINRRGKKLYENIWYKDNIF